MVNYKKLVSYLLSFVIALSPVLMINSANAQTVGGWTVNNVAAQGAKAIVSASQNVMINGKEYIKKGTALVAPTASQVSKVLVRGGAAYALSFAVEQLLGSVSWILDPANNQIVYTKPNDSNDPKDPSQQYYYTVTISHMGKEVGYKEASSVQALASYACSVGAEYNKTLTGSVVSVQNNFIQCETKDGSYAGVSARRIANPAYNPDSAEQDDKKTLPLDVVSQQVISNAEGGNTHAQAATVAAAQDIVNDAEKDDAKAAPLVNQFENSATTENADAAEQDAANDATGQTKPNEAGGTDLKLQFPAFCGWAPTVCQAAQVVINFPKKLEDWYKQSTKAISEAYTATKEWFQKDRENTDDQIDIPTPPKPDIDTNINFNSSCPAPITLASFSYHGSSQNWQVDFSQLCDSFSTFVKPVVIAMGAFSAVLIVSGVRTNE